MESMVKILVPFYNLAIRTELWLGGHPLGVMGFVSRPGWEAGGGPPPSPLDVSRLGCRGRLMLHLGPGSLGSVLLNFLLLVKPSCLLAAH